MEVKAKLTNLRIAPRKVRLLANSVRGRLVREVLADLAWQSKRAAKPLAKLIRSAQANATNNYKIKEDDLIVKRIQVDDAITMKRYRPRAFGRAAVIRKRGSHITLILDGQHSKEVSKSVAEEKKKTKGVQGTDNMNTKR